MTGTSDAQALYDRWVMPTYARLPVTFVRGKGTRLWDADGKEYVDFVSGISVLSVGHCHPKVVHAVKRQVDELIHCSNLYYSEPAARLAERLARGSLGGKVFLCGSGAEANEAAIKLARKHAHQKGGASGNGKIVVSEGAFHGRTLGALAATPQPEKQAPFAPMLAGFTTVPRNDVKALAAVCDSETIAVLLEPIQGESGVNVLQPEFLRAVREHCDKHGALLIFDEVQCGLGRTGSLWAYEQTGVAPDAITTAKALAGGLPIGGVVTAPAFADVLAPGDHGSTFGGNPVSCAAALAVLDIVEDEELLAQVRELGHEFQYGLEELAAEGKVAEVRGRGLMIGIDLPGESGAPEVVRDALAEGLVINATGPRTLRFLPPLVIEVQELAKLLGFLKRRLA